MSLKELLFCNDSAILCNFFGTLFLAHRPGPEFDVHLFGKYGKVLLVKEPAHDQRTMARALGGGGKYGF